VWYVLLHAKNVSRAQIEEIATCLSVKRVAVNIFNIKTCAGVYGRVIFMLCHKKMLSAGKRWAV